MKAVNEKAAPETQEGRREIQLACFRVGSEMYALDIMRIKEIIRPQKLTSVPKAPQFIEGVINLRGVVIPVVDLRKRFDQTNTALGQKARVIICTVSGKIVGLMVDEVLEVRRCTRQEIQSSPQFLQGKGTDFFIGVYRRDDDLMMLLNLEKILTSSEKINLEAIQEIHRKATEKA